MDAYLEHLADTLGASAAQIKLISCLLLSYPLAKIFTHIPRSQPNLKHLFNIGVSVFYFLGVFGIFWGFLQLLASSLAVYVFARWKREEHYMPWIVFGVAMVHLFANHVDRTMRSVSFKQYDITGPQMVMTLKLTTFAWNVWDGTRPVADLDKTQLESRITNFPSLLEFLGHIFYFPAVLVGHSKDLLTYRALCHGTLFANVTEEDANRRVPKGRKRVAMRKLGMGIGFLIAYVLSAPQFSYDVILHDSWLVKGTLNRLFTVQLIGIVERTKYYAAWSLSEGACIFTGLGFSGYDKNGKSTWDGVSNLNIPWIELAPNFKVLLDSWNIRTNIWLRDCVYKRITPKGQKPGFQSTILTFTTSAIWHGTYSGYYLTFLVGGFIQTAARLVRANIRPLFLHPFEIVPPKDLKFPDKWAKLREAIQKIPPPPPSLPKRIYDVTGTIATSMILNFVVAPFCLWYWGRSMEAWSRMNWYGLWMIGLTFAFFYGGGAKLCKRLKEQRLERARTRMEKELSIPKGEYTHPTLRTKEMKGIGAPGVVPVDEAAKEFAGLVEKVMEQHNLHVPKKNE